MRKIDLYIADQKVDLDDNSFIFFNYTMEDLSNPTIVKNSFSKQITLKGTPANNRIFGDLYRLDRKTEYKESNVGSSYNPLRKTPFAIYNEREELLESGYVKVDSIVRVGSSYEYKVTLYGGLGAFFYALMYNEDGLARTLNSLKYKWVDGNYRQGAGQFFPNDPLEVMQDCWLYLASPMDYEQNYDAHSIWWCNVVNFAPCYNGIPDKFSADKMIIKNKIYDNIYSVNQKEGCTSNLVTMTHPHSEWEMQDLRWYLQRPVISIKALFDAICNSENNGGYQVNLSKSFFNEDNALYHEGWLTLPMIKSEDRHSDDPLGYLLNSTLTPADYLISFAKIFGLVFVMTDKKELSIMTRREFFSLQNEVIDLTDRINVDDISITPILADSHFYQLGGGAVGAWSEDYKRDYLRDYGIQIVNTGNEFNSDTKELTKDLAYKDAIDVAERSLLYYSNSLARDEMGGIVELLYLPRYETMKIQEWFPSDDEEAGEEMKERVLTCDYEWQRFPFNAHFPLSDIFPKVQFHDAENKVTNGENVLLVFNGMVQTPDWKVYGKRYQLRYRVTDDAPDQALLNEGEPCWNFTGDNTWYVTQLPSFHRYKTIDDGDKKTITASYEWGESMARGDQGVSYDSSDPSTIYNRWWRKYLSDRYSTDTYLMSCKANLRGMEVGQLLLGRFFYFQGSIFVLNKITNHSITTNDLTECEFVRVQDINNYTK